MTSKVYTFSWVAISSKVKGAAGSRISVDACSHSNALYRAESEIRRNEIGWMLKLVGNEDIQVHLSLEKAVKIR